MGWQVGLQAATLLAVGGVNGQIKEQTTVLAENLDALKNETIEGFSSVSEAINSLEASLISGIEDIKWFLGSIDNKLGKLVGLIEFSRATESTEQFKIGMELYKQEFYDKAKKCFEQSLEKNPLNLNAKAGLFLTLKELKKKKEPKILLDLVKLTSGDFLYHTKASQETKEIKTNYFINFCFAELLENKSYKEIINLYDNEISSFSKEYLPIKLKYVNALVLSGEEYSHYLDQIFTEGQLEKLMVFFKYEEKNKHLVGFIEEVTNFIRRRLPSPGSYMISETPSTAVESKAKFFKEKVFNDTKMLLKLGFYETSLSAKVKSLKTFFEAAQSAPTLKKNLENLLETNTKNLEIIKSIDKPSFFKTEDPYLKEALKQIVSLTNNHVKKYKEKTIKDLENQSTVLRKALKDYLSGYPRLDQDTQEACEIIRTFISNIDEKRQTIQLDKIFSKEALKNIKDE